MYKFILNLNHYGGAFSLEGDRFYNILTLSMLRLLSPMEENAKGFVNHLNPVMLVFLG